MFGLGFPEVAFIIVLALLIFGPKRLPELGRTLGKGLGEFRRDSNDLKRTFNAELSLDDDEERPAVSRRSLREGDGPAEPRSRTAPDQNLPDLREPREGRVARGSTQPEEVSRSEDADPSKSGAARSDAPDTDKG
jgi:TatA/E family protein of Tat protein translocase